MKDKYNDGLVPGWKKTLTMYPWGGWAGTRLPPDQAADSMGSSQQSGVGGITVATGSDWSDDGQESGNKGSSGNKPVDGEETDNRSDEIPYYEGRKTPTNIGQKGDKILKFECLDDFIAAADDRRLSRSNWQDRESRNKSRDGSWSSTRTFDEAIALARNGWPEGIVKIDELADDFVKRTRIVPDVAVDLDVAGSHPCIPTFLSGDPANMHTDGLTRRKPKPVINIMYNGVGNAGMDSELFFNYGAALLVVIDQIESLGTRVELDSVIVNGHYNRAGTFATWVTIKRPGEHVEKSRLAYASGHASYLRRLWFSILEQQPDQPKERYGAAHEMPKAYRPEGCIYLGNIDSNYSHLSSVDKAVAWLQKQVGLRVDGGTLSWKEDEQEAA